MTHAFRRAVRRAALATCALGVTAVAGAQSAPPKPATDTAGPPLRVMKAPATPPPRSNARAAATLAPTNAEPLRAMQRVGTPVDSARPKAPAPVALDPSRAPAKTVIAPPSATTAAAQPAARAALTVADTPPAGATARCKDGTYVTRAVDANTCGANGGIAVRFPQPSQTTAPRRPNP